MDQAVSGTNAAIFKLCHHYQNEGHEGQGRKKPDNLDGPRHQDDIHARREGQEEP